MQRLQAATKRIAENSPTEQCAAEVLDVLPPVFWFVRRHMRAYREGLSLPQFRSLVRINRQPSASLSSVAEHLGASLPTTSRIVAGLVDKGLITREGSRHDRRQLSLMITPRGKAMLNKATRATRRRLEQEFLTMPTEDCVTISKAMDILRAVFNPVGEPRANAEPNRVTDESID